MTLDEVPKMAAEGDPTAQEAYGWMLFEGHHIPRNYTDAMYWFLKAADQGSVEAQYNIALMYARGLGVAKDMDESAKWVQSASRGGI